jgi:hypothetical protein
MKSKNNKIVAGHVGKRFREGVAFFQNEEPAYVPCRYVSRCRKSCPDGDSNCRIKRFYDKYSHSYTPQASQLLE